MATLYKHRIYCETEAALRYLWKENDTAITVCPTDPAHTVTSGSAAIESFLPESVVSAAGVPVVEVGLRVGKAGTRPISVVSSDLSDKTSWYQKSVRVTDEVFTDSGDHLTYNSVNPDWINIDGKLTYYYKSIPKRDGTLGAHADYRVVVKVDDVVQATNLYTVNFATGQIVFGSSQGAGVVKASYSHINGVTNPSEWLLLPPPGKKYVIEHVELQFSKNVGAFQDVIRFEIWAGLTTGTPKVANVAGYAGFIDAYFDAGYGQLRADYRNIRDLINASNEGVGFIPACGELANDVLVFPFNYVQATTLDSAVGTLFRMVTKNNGVISGCELATATFYLIVMPS